MSNPLRYDPVLVRALALELSAALVGRACHPLPRFDADLTAVLGVDRGEELRWSLHPSRGSVELGPAPQREGREPAATARIVRVMAPPDERQLRIDLHEGSRYRGAARSLVFELQTNQWNALVVDRTTGRIVSVLRAREAGDRSIVPGADHAPPPPAGRSFPDEPGARDRWLEALAPLPPEERSREAVRRFAWCSPLNAGTVLGDAARDPGTGSLDAAFERWTALAAGTGAGAFLLRRGAETHPYPVPLAGWDAEPVAALLAAMAPPARSIAEEAGGEATALLPPARRRVAAADRRIERLGAEMERAGAAERLRGFGDLILAHLHRVPQGASRISLPAFDGGGDVEIELDGALRPHENAERYYAEARRRDRAEARVPALIAAADAERARWSEAVARLEAGEVPAWARAALHRAPAERSAAADATERLPYRAYRTSGGLEVRVGRTSRDNDRLTFQHAAPGDVWLHARSVPGSHVVLRWASDDAPPARDLEEAAVLAALASKARTSGTVAVDWTRRRYVRKPRGAPPGRVALLRAKTIFVEPDPAVEERMTHAEPSGE